MQPNRRDVLQGSLLATSSLLAARWLPDGGWGMGPDGSVFNAMYPFELPALPFAHDALEPHIDKATMELHHGKHHQAYINNLNNALKDQTEFQSWTLGQLLSGLEKLPETIRTVVRNNAGGHANHSMFWTSMAPAGSGGGPTGGFNDAINASFGSLENLVKAFNEAGAKVFGSGWVFLVVEPGDSKKLAIQSAPNQDTPVSKGTVVLMGNDCWEHAYYLKYQNRRAEYLAAWWNVVNWKTIEGRFASAAKQ